MPCPAWPEPHASTARRRGAAPPAAPATSMYGDKQQTQDLFEVFGRKKRKSSRRKDRSKRGGSKPLHSWDLVKACVEGGGQDELPRDFCGPGFAPASPTEALPGSPEKVDVLKERFARRQQLFHPGDAGLDLEADCRRRMEVLDALLRMQAQQQVEGM